MFEKHCSSQIQSFSKYCFYSELAVRIQKRICPSPSQGCSPVSKVGKHTGYRGGAPFSERMGMVSCSQGRLPGRGNVSVEQADTAELCGDHVRGGSLQFAGLKFREEVQIGDIMCVKMLCKL